jgi:hypothetical protein
MVYFEKNYRAVKVLLPGDSAVVRGRRRALLPFAIPFERTGDRTRSPVSCAIEGDEQVCVPLSLHSASSTALPISRQLGS